MTYPRNEPDPADVMEKSGAAQLRAFIERIERLDEEAKALNEDKAEVYSEAKGTGFCTKTIKRIIALRRKDPSQRQEEDAMLELYENALGMK